MNTNSAIKLFKTKTAGNCNGGTAQTPVVISTYPNDAPPATLNFSDPDKHGIDISNLGGVVIRNLILVGPGAAISQNNGISLYTDATTPDKLEYIRVDKCTATGFMNGLLMSAVAGSFSGFGDVRITHSSFRGNRMNGLCTKGTWPDKWKTRNHRDVYVGHCEFSGNRGDSTYTLDQSGDGAVLASVRGGLVEYCHAFDNGRNNSSAEGNGPAGIWTWESDSVVIQYNISHGNKSGNGSDGGGFAIDGGSTNCVLQYNYSYHNQGAGYAFFQFLLSTSFEGNTIRYNISQNDGRAVGPLNSGVGGIHVRGETGYGPGNTVYGNTIYNDLAEAVIFTKVGMKARFCNNIFVTGNGKPLIVGLPNPPIRDVQFMNNLYWTQGGPLDVVGYSTLAAWRLDTYQERYNGQDKGIFADPLLRSPGGGDTSLVDPTKLAELTAYKLKDGSPAIDAGIQIQQEFQLQPGTRDFFGDPIPVGAFDIGANESNSTTGLWRAWWRPSSGVPLGAMRGYTASGRRESGRESGPVRVRFQPPQKRPSSSESSFE